MTVFETDRLVARAWTLDDAEAAFEIYGDAEVMRFLGDGTSGPVPDVERMRAVLQARQARIAGLPPGMGIWALVLRSTGEIVGSVALVPLEEGPEVEVAYHLARRAWGNGYATEAARAAVRYGFETLGLSRIVAVAYPENERSLRVLERIGMRHEGRRRHYGHDLEYYVAEV